MPPSKENKTLVSAAETADQLKNFLAIAIALSAEKDTTKLMEMIIREARRITIADAGTLYLREDDSLKIKIIHNDSMQTFLGGKGEKIDLPPVPLSRHYVSGYVALSGKSVNIPDVYTATDFDFSGPHKYDKLTGYRTTSILVIPLKNHLEEVIGVLQLINAMDDAKQKIIPFSLTYQPIIEALSSLAAISLTNTQLVKEIETLFDSFVQAMATAIEARIPYNAAHTKNVTRLVSLLSTQINALQTGVFKDISFNQDQLKELSTASWLHDIGKVAVPLTIINKPTRLDYRLDSILMRIEYAIQKELNLFFKHHLPISSETKQTKHSKNSGDNKKEAVATKQQLTSVEKITAFKQAKELIIRANKADYFIDSKIKQQLEDIAKLTYISPDEQNIPLLTSEELTSLTIPKGTLTADERQIVQDHVKITQEILAKIPFPKNLAQVPRFACMHHEQPGGNGYPLGVKGDNLPLEARILAVADVFDALTASDRPYKKAMPIEKALQVMTFMAKDGVLDADLVELFITKRVWEGAENLCQRKNSLSP